MRLVELEEKGSIQGRDYGLRYSGRPQGQVDQFAGRHNRRVQNVRLGGGRGRARAGLDGNSKRPVEGPGGGARIDHPAGGHRIE
jgi:hypothetical protein